MKHGALLAGGVALVASASFAFKFDAPVGATKELLGVPVEAALRTLKRLDPGAYLGELCRGKQGVIAAIQQLGIDWQVAAHSDGSKVTELALFSSSPRPGDREACRQLFKTNVYENLRRDHPDWNVNVYEKDFDATGFNFVARGTLADGTSLNAYAQRFHASGGLCVMSVNYELRTPGDG